MSELNKVVRTSQETFNSIAEGTHQTHTYDNNNMYQVELEDPILIGDSGTGLTIDDNNKLNADVKDVKLDNTSIVSGGDAIIPISTGNNLGVVKVSSSNNGITVSNVGDLSISGANENEMIAKNSPTKPIVTSGLDIAIREGLGNNSLTWTDQYKTNARNTIGATVGAKVGSSSGTALQVVDGYIILPVYDGGNE